MRAQAVYQTHWDIRIRTSGTYSSDLSPRFISAIMRLTSGGNARPFRSFSAGTARAAAPGGGAAAEPMEPDVETAETRFSGVAPFSAVGGPCFAAALTGRAINSSYPQRSHCHEGNTSLGSPVLWYTARCDGMILPPQRGQARPRVVRRSMSILSCCAKSSKEPQDFLPDDRGGLASRFAMPESNDEYRAKDRDWRHQQYQHPNVKISDERTVGSD